MYKLFIKRLCIFLFVLSFSLTLYSQQTAPVVHEANTNPLGITLSRQVPREYNPGALMEIVVNIYCNAPDPNYPVTAIGLYEMLPADWTFVSMRGITTEPPPIAPAPGTSGTLQFAWITPPSFPCTFAYTVQVPEGAVGVKTISGQVEYRTNGPRLVSSPEITEINGIDRIPPEITLLGDNPFTIYQGTTYLEPGYKATDNADGDITNRVQVGGNVDINQPGEYNLTYTVRDNAGNNATATRLVRVLERSSQTPSTGGVVTPPVSGGPVVIPPPLPTTQPTRPMQTATNQSQPQTMTSAPDKTQTPRPEEVTFPRMNIPPKTSAKEGSPQGIASGNPLKPFEIPKEIQGGAKPPPNFEKNRIPTQIDGNKVSEKIKQVEIAEDKSNEVSENTTAVATGPKMETIGEDKKEKNVVSGGIDVSASITTAENTSPLGMIPIKIDTGSRGTPFSFIGGFKDWWGNKTQPERRNLIGMFVLLGLLSLLCFITGRTAYQGITPQPRQKKVEMVDTESGIEK